MVIRRTGKCSLEVSASSPENLQKLLSKAEAALIRIALDLGNRGIVVTRHSPSKYTLELTEKVPFGETREQIAVAHDVNGLGKVLLEHPVCA
ncbi:hypothetical protein [Arthrobacter sp. C152]